MQAVQSTHLFGNSNDSGNHNHVFQALISKIALKTHFLTMFFDAGSSTSII